jgi:hypothetical protein
VLSTTSVRRRARRTLIDGDATCQMPPWLRFGLTVAVSVKEGSNASNGMDAPTR